MPYGLVLVNRSAFSGLARFKGGKGHCERPKAIFAGRKRLSAILDRSIKMADTKGVKILRGIQFNFSLLTFASQQEATLWILGHDVHGKERTFGPVNFETGRCMLYRKGIVKLRQDARLQIILRPSRHPPLRLAQDLG